MDIIQIKEELKGFLFGSFRIKKIEDSDNIFDTGVVHSLFFIQLLIFIEKKFKVDLHEGEFDVDKLTTIEAISQLISSKLAYAQ